MAIGNAINSLQLLSPTSSPTFAGLNLTGLTASRMLGTDGSKNLVSIAAMSSFILGTVNQITVTDNGNGTVTLSTPQDIATTSRVRFDGGATFGIAQTNVVYVRIAPQSIAGTYTVLLVDGTVVSLLGGQSALVSIAGTLNPTAGATSVFATISQPVFIAPGGQTITNAENLLISNTLAFNVGTITNVYGIIIGAGSSGTGTITNHFALYVTAPGFGTNKYTAYFDSGVGIGALNLTTSGIAFQVTGGGTNYYIEKMTGTLLVTDTAATTGAQRGIFVQPTFTPTANPAAGSAATGIGSFPIFAPAGGTLTTAAAFRASNLFTGNAGTITAAYGVYVDAGGALVGTVTTHYGGYFTAPTAGTTKIALYTDNLSIGYTTTAPPTNGAIIGGAVAIGTSSATGGTLNVSVLTSAYYGIQLSGTWLVTSNGATTGFQVAYRLAPNFTPTVNPTAGSIAYGFVSLCTFAPAGGTLTDSFCYWARPVFTGNGGTLTNCYGYYYDGISALVGAVTNHYGGFFNLPSAGTNRQSLYCADLSVGYAASGTAATGSLGVSGPFSVGTQSPVGGSTASITSALAIGLYLTGTQALVTSTIYSMLIITTMNPTNGGSLNIGVYCTPTFISPSAQTVTTAVCFYARQNLASNVGTITTSAGFYFDGGSSATGTVTNNYGGYFVTAAAGTNRQALYCADLSVGYVASGSAVAGSVIVSGTFSVGSQPVIAGSTASVTSVTGYGLVVTGTQIAVNGANQFSILINGTLNPTSGSTLSYGFYNTSTFIAPSAQTIANAACYAARPILSSNVGTISFMVGFFYDGGTSSTGTVTANYGGYFVTPTSGTDKQALYCANFSVGVLASGTPTVGTIKTAPPASSTVTTAFVATLTAGTAQQNTTGYDILINISVAVTSSTAATITMGVGSTSTPTKQTIVASFTTATAIIVNFCAYIPHNYYVLVDKTGTITIASITTAAMGV